MAKLIVAIVIALSIGFGLGANVVAQNELALRDNYTRAALLTNTVIFNAQVLRCRLSTSAPSEDVADKGRAMLDEARRAMDSEPSVIPVWQLWRLHRIDSLSNEAAASMEC